MEIGYGLAGGRIGNYLAGGGIGNYFYCVRANCDGFVKIQDTEEKQVDKRFDMYRATHDGFEGALIGTYATIQGLEGVVLQQVGTKVVHVYRRTSVEFLGEREVPK